MADISAATRPKNITPDPRGFVSPTTRFTVSGSTFKLITPSYTPLPCLWSKPEPFSGSYFKFNARHGILRQELLVLWVPFQKFIAPWGHIVVRFTVLQGFSELYQLLPIVGSVLIPNRPVITVGTPSPSRILRLSSLRYWLSRGDPAAWAYTSHGYLFINDDFTIMIMIILVTCEYHCQQ